MESQRPSSHPRQWIGQRVTVQIDRPIGSRHPQFEAMIYPVNYGFVPGTMAADGGAVDAYVLGVSGPLERFEGRCIAVIHRVDDCEDKLVIAPEGRVFSDVDILEAVSFQERYFTTALLR